MAAPDMGTKRQCMACAARFYDLKKPKITCPKCGAAVHAHGTNYVCTNSLASPAQAAPSCDFKTGQVILQQAISAEQLGKLLATGRTDLLDGFISARTQKAFKAMLVWDGKAGKVGFEFGSSRA